jgi:hypothetical protein
MKRNVRNVRTMRSNLRELLDSMALEPGQKEGAADAARRLIHASKVRDHDKMLRAASDLISYFLKSVDQ